jgi:hypothetical protein
MRRAGSTDQRFNRPIWDGFMRAETEKVVEDIKRSVGLLRRHL